MSSRPKKLTSVKALHSSAGTPFAGLIFAVNAGRTHDTCAGDFGDISMAADNLTADQQCREQLAKNLAEWQQWQTLAASKGWKLPGNSPLSNESWISYWRNCDAYERDPSGGRPVPPHRSA